MGFEIGVLIGASFGCSLGYVLGAIIRTGNQAELSALNSQTVQIGQVEREPELPLATLNVH